MIAATIGKLSTMLRANTTGSIRNPVTIKKIGMKNEFPKNSSFAFAGLSIAALTYFIFRFVRRPLLQQARHG
jgi:hypothetical protein